MQKLLLLLSIPVAISCTGAFVSWQIYSLREKLKEDQENEDLLFSKELWVIIARGTILVIIMPILCFLAIALGVIALIIYAVYKLDFWLLPATIYIDDNFSEPTALTKKLFRMGENIQRGDDKEIVRIEIPDLTPQEAMEYLEKLGKESEVISPGKVATAVKALEVMAKKECDSVTLQFLLYPEKVVLGIIPNRST